ncbi:proteasome assembly chaperone family protein [Halomicroarcula sp. GCM10025324]|uniref:proteasome assembly chaperone family protein n=1 Tax=Haloarcula TaxID=2237 RepID=UPI0023E8D28F|nr:PAC2 family protein [Halomicroarcula sp. ZS-22-S1]
MAHVEVHREDITLDEPTLVEGLPGVGLVGKIAADHLVEVYDMDHYASAHCDGLPEIGVYAEGDPQIRSPVRFYADEATDLLVLQSEAPISPSGATQFSSCVVGWFESVNATPVFLSGMATELEGGEEPSVYGVSTGDGAPLLESAGIDVPTEAGAITGPTGALIHEANTAGMTSVGLVVEADRQFPDPMAARRLLSEGIGPLIDVDIETDVLVEQAEQIRHAKARLAEQLQDSEESTSARPLGMYQ